jgi:hypothetical protein
MIPISVVFTGRYAAHPDDPFVVFLIGSRLGGHNDAAVPEL